VRLFFGNVNYSDLCKKIQARPAKPSEQGENITKDDS
jgi:hypothetical protein